MNKKYTRLILGMISIVGVLICVLAIHGHNQPKPVSYVYEGSLNGSFVERVVAIEDARFWTHRGWDLRATVRAGVDSILKGRISQGGSTIEQQYLKLRDDAYANRTLNRKIYETISALSLNIVNSKSNLLEAYLGSVAFPYGTVGVNAGCRLMFDAQCDALDVDEQMLVIATFQTGANPFTEIGYARVSERASLLCSTMQWDCAYRIDERTRLVGGGETVPPHIEPVRQQSGLVRDDKLYSEIQSLIEVLDPLMQEWGANDCCVIVRQKDGSIASMNVCREWSDAESGKVNVCQYDRQTGSIIKPFVYQYAREVLGVTMSDTRIDQALSFPEENGGVYQPKNFDLKHYGTLTLAQALGSSINTIAVSILHEAGVDGFVPFLSRLRVEQGTSRERVDADAERFSAERQGLSLALGTYELSPEEFSELWQYTVSDDANKEQWSEIDQVLRDPLSRLYGFGQDSHLAVPGRSVKTGTSRAFVDGRTCGTSSPELGTQSVCVRVGNADATPMRYPGSQTAGVVWRRVVDLLK